MEKQLFSKRDLVWLILPLVGEQFLAQALGIVDTVMVASVGEAAISAISLVNIIATLVIQLLAALCTGGAVVVSQYLGRRDLDNASKSARQLLLLSVGFMTVITVVLLLLHQPVLRAAFGAVDDDVMQNARIYLLITAVSFPFLAAYNAAAAVFRSIGNSRAAMNTSLIMNIVNIVGNAAFIYGMNMGVAGAAWSTLFSRIASAVIVILLLRNKDLPVYITDYRIRPDRGILKSIFHIGVPSGIENSLFNFGKLLVQGLVAGLGTAALAANAVLNSVSAVLIVPGSAISYAILTVVGQCVGAGDYKQAEYYTKKLMKLACIAMAVANLPLLLIGRPVMGLFNLSEQGLALAMYVLPFDIFAHSLIWPVSFSLPNVLRAAGDVRYTMIVAFISMWTMRVGLSYVFIMLLDMGVAGVWFSMFMDWILRSIFFTLRYRSGKWKTKQVI